MNEVNSVLLLVGSPRPGGGSSALLGGYVLDQLRAQGKAVKSIRLAAALAQPDHTDRMLLAVSQADLLLLAFPVYIDTLPAQCIRVLEMIAARRGIDARPWAIAAITNCGYAEAVQTEVALQICEQFAREQQIAWLGGLGMPMGGAVNESLMAQPKGMLRHQLAALKGAADAWGQGQVVPPEAVVEMAKPLMPAWLYRMAANFGWRQEKHGSGTAESLRSRPFKPTKR